MFKVRQKVVCIKYDFHSDGTSISEGEIRIVSGIEETPSGYYPRFGLVFYDHPGYVWCHYCFRPLDYAFVEEVIKQIQPEKQPA